MYLKTGNITIYMLHSLCAAWLLWRTSLASEIGEHERVRPLTRLAHQISEVGLARHEFGAI
jgi:hypothetical protein